MKYSKSRIAEIAGMGSAGGFAAYLADEHYGSAFVCFLLAIGLILLSEWWEEKGE